MKKRQLTHLALLGISTILLLEGCEQKNNNQTSQISTEEIISSNKEIQAFYDSLSSEGKEKFKELDEEHRMLAMKMAQQGCASQHGCQGNSYNKVGASCGNGSCSANPPAKDTNAYDKTGAACGGPPRSDANAAVNAQLNNQNEERSKVNSTLQNENRDQ